MLTPRASLALPFVLAIVSSLSCTETPPAGPYDDRERSPAPPAWNAPGSVDLQAFPRGIQVTDVLPTGALVSVHTQEATLNLVVMRGDSERWSEHETRAGLTPNDGLLQLDLDNLTPDNIWSLAFYSADNSRRSALVTFRTALESEDSRIVRFGATSCLGNQNVPWLSLSRAAEENLDFVILAGDTVYADGSRTLLDYQREWEYAFSSKEVRDLSASTSLIATWDDHEVDNNWSWDNELTTTIFPLALEAFRQALPWREGPGESTLWRSIKWGRTIEVFMLDVRSERRNGNYISQQQMDWLNQSLLTSDARFKLVLTSVPMTDFTDVIGNVDEIDRWQGYPHQRGELLDNIVGNKIPGVFFVAGDHHFGLVGHVDPPKSIGDNLWEVLVGPAGSFINPLTTVGLIVPNDQFEHVISDWTYTWFEANPKAGTVRMKFIDDDGQALVDFTIQP